MVTRLCAISALLLSASVQAADSPRQPAKPWTVDYLPSQCVASRDYGSEERPLFLVLKPSPFGGVMRLVVVEKGRAPVAQFDGKLSFDGKPALRAGVLTYTDDKNDNRAAAVNIPMAYFKANRTARSLSLWGGWLSQTLVITKLPEVAAELEKCLQSLQQEWSIGLSDRARRISREAAPKKPMNSYFSRTDYPMPALRDGQSGSVKLVFLVDENGTVSDCSVDETSGVASLDAMSCYVMQSRAKFTPAAGPDGRPTKSAYCSRVTWRMAWETSRKISTPPSDPRCPPRS
jgi:TonB family protein